MPVALRWLLRLGPMNPIAVRLVQGGSRRKRHLYIRSIYLGVLVLALLYMLILAPRSTTFSVRELAASASSAFAMVANLQIALICLLAPVFMAGAIAQEANPRTWDILLTTPLGATEIVLGNLLGRLFFILALLFSSLPLFALTQYFGGVPSSSIFLSYLVSAAAALLVGSMAIALSVSRLVGKRAVFAFYVSVVSYLAITWAVDWIFATPKFVSAMTAINPFLAMRALLDSSGYQAYPVGTFTGIKAWIYQSPVATWCIGACVVSVVLVGASALTVRAGGIAGAGGLTGREGGGGKAPWYRRMFGLGAQGSETRPARTVWNNPIAWREAAARNATFGKMLARWSFIAIGGLWGLGLVMWFAGAGRSMSVDEFRKILLATVVGELAVVTLIAVNMSATAVAREREDGTLDLLLTTPITPAAYLSGKVRGMVAYLLPLLAVPLGTLLIAGGYVAMVMAGLLSREGGVTAKVQLTRVAGETVTVPAVLPEVGILGLVVGVPFIAVCCLIGLHWSLKSKGSIGSVVWTVVVVGALAGVVGFCAMTAGSSIDTVGPVLSPLSPGALVYAGIMPESGMSDTVTTHGNLAGARVALVIGSALSAGIMIAIAYALRANLVHGFDMTVRKLAGAA